MDLDALARRGALTPITYHHGVGQLKGGWLGRELDGFAPYLGRVQEAFDPRGIMNPHPLRIP